MAARPIRGPLLGQIQFAVKKRATGGRGVGHKHADLTVLTFAGGAAILAFDADGLGAFLEEAGFINDQHRIGMAEVLDDVGTQVVADLIGVPVGGGEQALHAIRRGGAAVFGDLPLFLRSMGLSSARR